MCFIFYLIIAKLLLFCKIGVIVKVIKTKGIRIKNKIILEMNRTIHQLQCLRDTDLPNKINLMTNNQEYKEKISNIILKEVEIGILNVQDELKDLKETDYSLDYLIELEAEYAQRNRNKEDKNYFKKEIMHLLNILEEK